MKVMALEAVCATLVTCSIAMTGCGSSDDGANAEPMAGSAATNPGGPAGNETGGGAFEVFPPKIYAGFDGMHMYKAPIIAVNAPGDVTWSIADPGVGSITPDPADSSELMIVAAGPGTTTITATSGGQSATASLEIITYTTEQYAAGEQRYKNGPDADNPACTECHAPGKGPDHTATELDADPDDEVQNTFLTGVDPEDRPIKDNSEYAYLLKGKDHMWSVTDVEIVGLMAYLRALEPMGYPEYDEPTTEK